MISERIMPLELKKKYSNIQGSITYSAIIHINLAFETLFTSGGIADITTHLLLYISLKNSGPTTLVKSYPWGLWLEQI